MGRKVTILILTVIVLIGLSGGYIVGGIQAYSRYQQDNQERQDQQDQQDRQYPCPGVRNGPIPD